MREFTWKDFERIPLLLTHEELRPQLNCNKIVVSLSDKSIGLSEIDASIKYDEDKDELYLQGTLDWTTVSQAVDKEAFYEAFSEVAIEDKPIVHHPYIVRMVGELRDKLLHAKWLKDGVLNLIKENAYGVSTGVGHVYEGSKSLGLFRSIKFEVTNKIMTTTSGGRVTLTPRPTEDGLEIIGTIYQYAGKTLPSEIDSVDIVYELPGANRCYKLLNVTVGDIKPSGAWSEVKFTAKRFTIDALDNVKEIPDVDESLFCLTLAEQQAIATGSNTMKRVISIMDDLDLEDFIAKNKKEELTIGKVSPIELRLEAIV